MDKFINDKVNELEVKDNFDSINKDVDYSKYVKVKTPFYKRSLFPRLIGGLSTLVCILVIVLIVTLGNLDVNLGNGNKPESNDPEAPEQIEPGVESAPTQDSSKPDEILPSFNYENNKPYLLFEAKEKANISKFREYTNVELPAFLNKINNFASKLTVELYNDSSKNKNDNYCISPVSIYMGLAMAIECSNGNTRDEILNTVGVTYKEVEMFTEYIFSVMNREAYSDDNETLYYCQKLANSIWINENLKLKKNGLERLASLYNCSSYYTPFTTNNENASKAVNDYIKEMTNGLITPEINYDSSTMFLLINTYYLKSNWSNSSKELKYTEEKYSFTEYDNDIKEINLLQGYYNEGLVYETDKYRQFYTTTTNGIVLKFIVPKNGYSINDIFTYETLQEVNSTNYKVFNHEEKLWYFTRCFFPEFTAKYQGNIAKSLMDMGIRDLFRKTDFTNITDDSAYCSEVYHEAILNVDKVGIEGAAATSVKAGAAGEPDYEKVYFDFVVDRDFIFIVNNGTGTRNKIMLFSGVVKEILL